MITIYVFIGSDNDIHFLKEGFQFLEERGIEYEMRVASVHRGPTAASATILRAIDNQNVRVIIGGAASATGLPGVIAGFVEERRRNIMVFGVRFEKAPSARIIEDASFALSSMPRRVPLAYTGFNNTGFLHACMLASRVILLNASREVKA